MTAYPVAENAGHWWLTTSARDDHLHAVPAADLSREEMEAALLDCGPVIRATACGPILTLMYPGLFSRDSLPRCANCCRIVGVPPGDGTPCNEQALNTHSGNP